MTPDKTPSDDPSASASTTTTAATEPLACVTCRARKLKCDRTKPACSRCIKVSNECVYPESRRRPTFKRRNVKELEARLAQVEVYLKEVNRSADEHEEQDDDLNQNGQVNGQPTDPVEKDQPDQSRIPFVSPTTDSLPDVTNSPLPNTQMMGLGMMEPPPPDEIVEDLNVTFFRKEYPLVSIIHPGRYMQAFYAGPLRKPPMCLQYIIWALAAVGHPKYDHYHEVFYRRARCYIEADEMSDHGERFTSINHAQAWTLIAFYEAKLMIFSRSTMSTARAVRLCQMLGLDRIDGDNLGLPPSLSPPLTWAELEERRRVFWGAFSIDAHVVIATGWATSINIEDVALRLPASEDAFMTDCKEDAPFIHEVFKGTPYSRFAGTILTCHVLKSILCHIHRSKPEDKAEDVVNGSFWTRHRDLDNMLSSMFMFLPEQFRLPQNIRDHSATNMNLSLHASIICLHHAVVEKCDKHGQLESVKQQSLTRLRTAAEEVVNIIRLASHSASAFKSPLCALSLYLTTTVYVYIAKQQPETELSPVDLSSLGIVITAMEAVSRTYKITRAFLQQTSLDIERNGLALAVHVPTLKKYRDAFGPPRSGIPMIARSSIAKHSAVEPLYAEYKYTQANQILDNNTPGPVYDASMDEEGNVPISCFSAILGAANRNIAVPDKTEPLSHKRKRAPGSPAPDRAGLDTTTTSTWSRSNTDFTRSLGNQAPWLTADAYYNGSFGAANMSLPDRTNSSTASSPANQGSGSRTKSGSSHTSVDIALCTGLGNTAEENRVDLRAFQDRITTPIWQSNEETLLAQFVETMGADGLPSDGSDPWGILNTNIDWDADDGQRNC